MSKVTKTLSGSCYYRFGSVKKMLFILLCAFMSQPLWAQTEISTVDQLKSIMDNPEGSYKLVADLSLSEDWVPLGTTDDPFTGTFDGNGHIIKGLKFSDETANNVGFIGVAQNATIKNVGFEDVYFIGRADVGAIIGKATASTIEGCYTTGYIQGYDHVGGVVGGTYPTDPEGNGKSMIFNCFSTAEVVSVSYQCGGILGLAADVEIHNVYFAGVCSTPNSNTGGIVSLIYKASEVYGDDANIISNSVVVSPYLKGGTITRRILANRGDNDKGMPYKLMNNYALQNMLINGVQIDDEEAMIGSDMPQGESKTMDELKSSAFYKSILGWDESVWRMNDGNYPVLLWQPEEALNIDRVVGLPTEPGNVSSGTDISVTAYSVMGLDVTYTSEDPEVATIDAEGKISCLKAGKTVIKASTAGNSLVMPASSEYHLNVITVSSSIRTAEDLNNIRYDLVGEYTLEEDIVLDAPWEPIEGFSGILNGNGHIIKGITFGDEKKSNVGLFGSTKGAVISKLGLENAELIGDVNVGALVGAAENTKITECYVANSYIEGRDHVGSIIGGILPNGEGSTIVQNCYATAEVTSRSTQAGGIAGTMGDGIIDKCFYSGIVKTQASNAGGIVSLIDNGVEQTISNCICHSPFMLGRNVGRILATKDNREATLNNNYARYDVMRGESESTLQGYDPEDPESISEGLNGITTAREFVYSSEFYETQLNWDMTTIWKMAGEGVIYPILAWQKTPITASVLNLPREKVRLVKGNSMKIKGYGSMGQPIYFETPQENTIVTMWLEYNAYDEIDFALFGTIGDNLQFGTATVKSSTDATEFITESETYFDIEVIDGESLKKEISSVEDLMNITEDMMGDYKLTCNIDLTSIASWTPIGNKQNPFKGKLDGNGYSIINLKYNNAGGNEVGLFGYTSGAVIKNLGVIDVEIIGNADVAAVSGGATGTTFSQVWVTGTIEGNDHVGGIVGMTYTGGASSISDCYCRATMSTRMAQVGGLAGVIQSTKIERSYSSGTVTAPTTDWQKNAGGLVGLSYDGNNELYGVVSLASSVTGGTTNPWIARGDVAVISNSLYRSDMVLSVGDESVPGYDQPSESAKKDLSSFYKQSTYEALEWDFSSVWKIESNEFPTLQIQKKIISGIENIDSDENEYVPYVQNGKLFITGIGKAEIVVFDLNGRLIAGSSAMSADTGIQLPTKGIYVVRVVENGKTMTFKVVNL
ncbi:T9SS type A sorting domain-containing protein [Coprobacter tertius]|uniref:T9SS type A sorting domain-containing protein n=1 Tax=Coprobacter tertius TaxID=2944915 RepID=A0ABT1MFS6_9BACT|nr:T9SS type A sorting domain-containing protein [Coprobacter tertius]MCP9611493.1 T9SS type A sorting domain-containing protein [Coprobacter tertius]